MTEQYFFKNTKLWADYVVNVLGCNDLKLQFMYIKNGNVISSQRISYWVLIHKDFNEPSGIWNLTVEQFWSKVNNFSGVDILVPLDFDDDDYNKYIILIKQLVRDGLIFVAYAAGERCKHIHLFFPELRDYSFSNRREFKHYIIEKYSCDGLKASDGQNLPICYPSPKGKEINHWKTGKPIKVVYKNV